MPICIECSYPVSHLYTSYSKADDHSLGKGVRLTQCPRCKRFADKYVEHDYVVLFIDLVLIKPQVYRHLLFNRLTRDENQVDRSIVRLGVLLLLFDVYLTWARIERSSSLSSAKISQTPIIVQYLFFLTLNGLATLAHHLTVRLLASVIVSRRWPKVLPVTDGRPQVPDTPSTPSTPIASVSNTDAASPSFTNKLTSSPSSPMGLSRTPSSQDALPPLQRPPPPIPGSTFPHPSGRSDPAGASLSTPTPHARLPLRRISTTMAQLQPPPPPNPASPSAISTALFVSSCPKLFPILLVIWGSKESEEPEGGIPVTGNPAATSLQRSVMSLGPTALSVASRVGLSPAKSGSSPLTSSMAQAIATGSTSSFTTWFTQAGLSFISLGAVSTYFVLLNNIEALYILLDCGYLRAVALAVSGQVARWVVEQSLLGLFGIW